MTTPSDPVFDATNPHVMADDREPYKLDASCVRIVVIEPRLCQNCGDETGKTATHRVFIDLVNNGQDMGLEGSCLTCAQEFADRLRASLPRGEIT